MDWKTYFNKGKMTLFAICFLAAFLAGAIGYMASDRLTAVSLSAIGGTLALLGINTLADLIGYGMPIGKSSGVTGVCLATLLILLI